ncbi:NAD(P)-dependent oxidoreductase [Streptomyces sp. NL15-2K]|uniref:NAD(P)-dependent oxidoreductase n=1 Tax=Streptomyces sp. NL15-2K TaxID=376149 RepID=UPI000F588054|nr:MULTISPECIES: NAD(P)-dependent oxidoreductase [Actinomycetes]WKX15021.1 NAD(P)-dependent oxidoreductase [Kutzneria buriramensis]GCB43281.1 D-beta-hydroxybutyrate dehydrogenase [Streptomyces sp. NL15-2K]
MSPRPRTAVLGLGAMGLPMARRLAGELPVVVYDISAERRALLTAEGATEAASPAEAAREADVVLLAVRDRAQVEGALFGPDGAAATLRPGAVVVLTSTVGPEAARAVAERLAPQDVLLVDAPVSGGPVRAGNGDLLIVVGAEDTALKAARPVLDLLASTLTVIGPRPGDGQALKAVNQLLAGVHIAAAAEAVALARGLGLAPATVVDSLKHGAAGSFMFADRGPRMVETYEDGPDPEVRSRLDIFVKDMGIVTGIAKDAHVPVPLAAAAEQLYLLGEHAGLGDRDDSSVVTVLSPKNTKNTEDTMDAKDTKDTKKPVRAAGDGR